MTATATDAVAVEPAVSVRIGCPGERPSWLALVEGCLELDGTQIVDPAGGGADVLHVRAAELGLLPALRRELPGTPLVLDLTGDGEARLGRRDARRARLASRILVGSISELNDLRRRFPSLGARAEPLTRPIDLDLHAPLPRLHETRDAEVKRFRRLHRLAGPMVLFGGPYTREGGLHLVLDAVYRIRQRLPELRLGAVPDGRVDPRYRDDCERQAMGLGHHGTIEWAPSPGDVPLWYGTASVVCTPALAPVTPTPARLAAAAARPFVGSRVEDLTDFVADGQTGFLIPSGDEETLAAALEALLGDDEEAERLGAAARAQAEAELAPAAVAQRLHQIWSGVAAEGDGRATTAERH